MTLVATLPIALPASGQEPSPAAGEALRVIVELDTAWQPEGDRNPGGVLRQREAIAEVGQEVADGLQDGEVVTEFETLPFITVEATPEEVRALLDDPQVASVRYDRRVPPALLEASEAVGATTLRAGGLDGSGATVAVVDTGVDSGSPFLAGKVIREACFADPDDDASTPEGDCPNGLLSEEGVGSAAPCAFSGCDHGTLVAGIVAGRNGSVNGSPQPLQGIANGASIAAYQVFGLNTPGNPSSGIGAWDTDVVKAMEHAFTNRAAFADQGAPLVAVNLSLGGGSFSTACDVQFPLYANATQQLGSVGVATVAAAGNGSQRDALMAPACVSEVIAVGSTSLEGSSETVSSFSSVDTGLDLLAPGEDLALLGLDGATSKDEQGTSFAAPQVAAAFALLADVQPDPGLPGDAADDVAARLAFLLEAGIPVSDTRPNAQTPTVTTPRLLLPACLLEGGPGQSPQCLRAPANDSLAAARELTDGTCSAADPCFTFGATTEAGEAEHVSTGVGRTVWFSWTASKDGLASFDTAGSDFNTALAVYTGTGVGDLELVGRDDDGGSGPDESRAVLRNLAVTAGTTYALAVDGSSSQVVGPEPVAGQVRLAVRDGDPDISVSVSARTTTGEKLKRPRLGEEFRYRVKLASTGGAPATDVTLEVPISSSHVLLGAPADCSAKRGRGADATCSFGTLARGASRTVNLTVVGVQDCTLWGGPGDDVLAGTTNDDVICGGGGADVLRGRGGRDVLLGNASGEPLRQRASVAFGPLPRSTKAEPLVLRLANPDGADLLVLGRGADDGDGGRGDDIIKGGPGTDVLVGSQGEDVCKAGTGAADYRDASCERPSSGKGWSGRATRPSVLL